MSDLISPSSPDSSCPFCGGKLRAGARFCPQCGKPFSHGPARGTASNPDLPHGVEAGSVASEQTAPEPVCLNCGRTLRPQSRFCPACGSARENTDGESMLREAAPLPAGASHSVVEPLMEGGRLHLVSAGSHPAAVIRFLRENLGLSARDAGAYVDVAPVLLAVGLTPAVGASLEAALNAVGATTRLELPPPPSPESAGGAETTPRPEPRRSLELRTRVLREVNAFGRARIVTGLSLGSAMTYLTFARAEGDSLLSPPDFVRFQARNGLPTAVRLAGGRAVEVGAEALASWPLHPEEVLPDFFPRLQREDAVTVEAAGAFLQEMSRRLVEVLGPAALAAEEGAATMLSIPAGWEEARAELLFELAVRAGFPVVAVVPAPLAAIAYHECLGTLRRPAAKEYVLVVDWGAGGLYLSLVERAPDLHPTVLSHFDLPQGGAVFDDLLYGWLGERITAEMSDGDGKDLWLFARDFKEQASRAFSDGKAEYGRYCVIPAGEPPTRVQLGRAGFEDLAGGLREAAREGLRAALNEVGLETGHLDHVILAGGGARWYFAREMLRSTLGIVPHIGPRPEEVVALGLAGHGLEPPAEA